SAQDHWSALKSSCASVKPRTSRAMRSYRATYSGKSTVPGASSVRVWGFIRFLCQAAAGWCAHDRATGVSDHPGGQGLHCLRDGLHATRVLEGREIARFLPKIRRPDHSAHNLGAAGFGQLAHKEHLVRTDSSAHSLHDAVDEDTTE